MCTDSNISTPAAFPPTADTLTNMERIPVDKDDRPEVRGERHVFVRKGLKRT